ncbi:MAG: radical SAM protein [Rhodocyclaceae bacterium]|jgi:hypothetical protein|nr:radical SAM protein [Rhodocyclaceae bacterium]
MSGVVLLRVDRANGSEGHPRHVHPALDLKYVQAGLQVAGCPSVPIVDGWRDGGGPASWVAQALRHAPRVVAIKAASWCLSEATECAAALKRHGVTTVAIGQQVEHRQRLRDPRWMAAFDVALLGEPEQELTRCIAGLLAGNPDRAHLLEHYRAAFEAGRRFQVADPAVLPRPAFDAGELAAYPFPFPVAAAPLHRWGYAMTAWGCPHACLHCTAIVRKSTQRGLQKRAPRDVADEVAGLLERGAQAISFEDDTLFADGRHFLALCEEFARRRLIFRWMANARPDELDDALLRAAVESGGCCLKVGVETGVPRLIEALGKARCGERWLARTEAGFAALRRHGMASVALFMVGLPGETEPDVDQSIRLALRIAPDYVQVQQFTAYPDIGLWTRAASAGDPDALYHYGAAADFPARMQRRFYRRFYLRPRFVFAHAVRYWRHYLHPAGQGASARALRFIVPFGKRTAASFRSR